MTIKLVIIIIFTFRQYSLSTTCAHGLFHIYYWFIIDYHLNHYTLCLTYNTIKTREFCQKYCYLNIKKYYNNKFEKNAVVFLLLKQQHVFVLLIKKKNMLPMLFSKECKLDMKLLFCFVFFYQTQRPCMLSSLGTVEHRSMNWWLSLSGRGKSECVKQIKLLN